MCFLLILSRTIHNNIHLTGRSKACYIINRNKFGSSQGIPLSHLPTYPTIYRHAPYGTIPLLNCSPQAEHIQQKCHHCGCVSCHASLTTASTSTLHQTGLSNKIKSGIQHPEEPGPNTTKASGDSEIHSSPRFSTSTSICAIAWISQHLGLFTCLALCPVEQRDENSIPLNDWQHFFVRQLIQTLGFFLGGFFFFFCQPFC